ncbi:MAG: outer membrane beta-barrel protein [Pseudobdellovibrio sp.]
MKKLIALFIILVSTSVFAQGSNSPNISYSMAGLEVGFKWAGADITGTDSSKQVLGFLVGGSAVFNFAPSFGLKTGLFYNERPFEATTAGAVNTKGKITYFDVPVLLMFKFEDYAGVYFGPSISMKMSDEISPGKLTDIKGMVVPITVGAQFKFAPNLGMNIYFESVSGDLALGVKNSRAVGASLLVTFD